MLINNKTNKGNTASKISASILAVSVLMVGGTVSVSAEALTRQLQIGMSGSDVGTLQTFLAADPSVYPQGLITSYFGGLTRSAVSNYQAKNGIANVGRVGPQTLAYINARLGNVGVGNPANSGSEAAPFISGMTVNVSGNNVNIIWNTNENAKGAVYYSTSPLNAYEGDNMVTVSGTGASTDNSFRTSQNVSLNSLQSNTTYYYMIYVTDQDGNVSVTVPTNTFRTN